MCSREECFECESEYDYELEREIENETRALAREDDEYEQLARTCDEYYDAHWREEPAARPTLQTLARARRGPDTA